jgi:hypothetical protein
MAKIPTFDNERSPVIGEQIPHADVAMAGAPGAALAGAGAELTSAAQPFVDQYVDARRQAAGNSLLADATAKQGDLEFRMSKIPDSVAALTGFDAEAAQIKAAVLAQTNDPLVQNFVTSRLDSQANARRESVRNAAFGLEASKYRGDLETQNNQYAQAAATATSDLLRQQFVDQANTGIDGAVKAGWLHPEEGARARIVFASRVSEVGARQDMNANPEAAAQKFADPASYPNMLPETRAVLERQAQRMSEAVQHQRIANQAHLDAVAERNLRAAQGSNEIQLLQAVEDGKDVDLAQVAQLGARQQISPAGYQAISTAIRQRQQGRDHPAAVVDLYRQLGDGDDVRADIYQALAAGQVKGSTAVELMKANDAQQKQGQSALQRATFDQLKTALGGHAIDQGLINLGDQDGRDKAALWASAQGEWNRRVLVGREDPQAVYGDMVPRYSHATLTTSAFPTPRLGAVNSTADVEAVWQRTRDAAAVGQISRGDLEREAYLLNQYRQKFAEQDAQRAAAPPLPTAAGPRARLRAVTPQ